MKEPFVLYRRCVKNGVGGRCPTWPDCDCDYYDRPTRPDGRRAWVHLPETAHNKQLAYRLANKKRQDTVLVAAGLQAPPAPPPPDVPLLSAYIAAYLETPDVKKQKTVAKLGKNLADFLAGIIDRPVNQVTAPMIDAWRDKLLTRHAKKTGGTWSRNTVQRVYNSVKGLFAYASEDEQFDDFINPCAKLSDWSEDPASRRLWHPDEQWLIKRLPPRFALPLEVGFCCSCRRTEALLLEKHDLSPKGFSFPHARPKLGWIQLQRKKKRRGMVKERIPIALSLVERLRKEIRSPFQRYVFGDPPPDPNAWSSLLTRELRKLGEQYGVDTTGLCMHGTRHTATTTMQDMPGVSSQTARNMGGWTTTRMVETYSSPADASMQAAAAGLARTWKPVMPKGLKKRTPHVKRPAKRRA